MNTVVRRCVLVAGIIFLIPVLPLGLLLIAIYIGSACKAAVRDQATRRALAEEAIDREEYQRILAWKRIPG